jgi:hypothetical protein
MKNASNSKYCFLNHWNPRRQAEENIIGLHRYYYRCPYLVPRLQRSSKTKTGSNTTEEHYYSMESCCLITYLRLTFTIELIFFSCAGCVESLKKWSIKFKHVFLNNVFTQNHSRGYARSSTRLRKVSPSSNPTTTCRIPLESSFHGLPNGMRNSDRAKNRNSRFWLSQSYICIHK